MNELQWIAYQLPSTQQRRGCQLRLFVSAFTIGRLSRTLWGDAAMTNYLHSILVHWAPFYLKYDFRNSTSEQGEAWLAILKRIFRSFSNRHPDQAILELLHRLKEEEAVKEMCRRKVKVVNRISTAYKERKVWNELECPLGEVKKIFSWLEEHGFSESNGDWNVTGSTVTFSTLPHILRVWKKS